MFGDFPYSQALEEVNYTWRRVLAMTLTLIPTTKGGEIIPTFLLKKQRDQRQGQIQNQNVYKPPHLQNQNMYIGLQYHDQRSKQRERRPTFEDMVMEHITNSDERFKSLECTKSKMD